MTSLRRMNALCRAVAFGGAIGLGVGACGGGSSDTPTPPPSPPAVARVDITPAGGSLSVGGTLALQAQSFTAGGTPITDRTVAWRSDALSVATVSSTGLVTAIASGNAPIVATIDGVSATATVSVRDVVRVEADSITLGLIGQNGDLRITRNGAPSTVTPTLALIDEQRWLTEFPVLDAASLAAGRVLAAGAGRSRVRVQVDGVIDTVIIAVSLARPRVFSVATPAGGGTHLGTGDTVVIRGYALNTLPVSALQANGFTPATAARDSASWRAVMSSATASCTGTPSPLTLSLAGSDGTFPTTLTRAYANELGLAVGEARRLTDAEAACLRVRPSGTARHLLAYADARLHVKAQTTAEFPYPDSATIRVTPVGVAGANVAGLRTDSDGVLTTTWARWLDPIAHETRDRAAHTDGMYRANAIVPVGCPYANTFLPFCRTTPYALGEVFTAYQFDRPSGPARVIAIRGNLVLALFRADSALLSANAIPRADSALRLFAERGVPWLQSVYGIAAPTTTTDESGQLFLLLDASPGSSAAWSNDTQGEFGRFGKVTLGMPEGSGFRVANVSYGLNYSIIAHEVTHTYQFRWRYQYAGPWRTYLGTGWGVEGGATFAQLQTLRETLGIAFDANMNFDLVQINEPAVSLQVGTRAMGDFTGGYTPAASFMRDMMQRLVQSGMTTTAAAREVAVGAMEGWYGINEEGVARGMGFTARMRARLGASWNPTDAMLQWTMTEAADDLTANPLYQNISNRKNQATTAGAALPPHGLVGPTTMSSVRRQAGNSGVFEVSDNIGTVFRADAVIAGASSPAMEWLVLRYR